MKKKWETKTSSSDSWGRLNAFLRSHHRVIWRVQWNYRQCTCRHICVLVRITNSSVLYDMLQNDLKFISNKSFWLWDGFFLSLDLFLLSSCFTSFYLFLLLWPICFHVCVGKTHVCLLSVRTYFFNVSQFWIVHYERVSVFVSVSVYLFAYSLTLFATWTSKLKWTEKSPLEIVNASKFVTIN